MKQMIYLILNSVTFIFTLLVNYLAGNGAFNNTSVGDISDQYDNMFTPAGYAFSIWGVIYLLLTIFIVFLWVQYNKKKDEEYIRLTGIWFIISNLANAFWVIAWVNDYIGLSLLLILVLLVSLLVLMFRFRMEIWDAPLRVIAFVWWPFSIYIGWMVVATMANLTTFSVKVQGSDSFALNPVYTGILVGLTGLIYFLFIQLRNMRESAFIGIWALVAISVKQWDNENLIAYLALAVSVFLLIFIFIQLAQNKETMPHKKLKRGEL